MNASTHLITQERVPAATQACTEHNARHVSITDDRSGSGTWIFQVAGIDREGVIALNALEQ